jgi:hypothetical protein
LSFAAGTDGDSKQVSVSDGVAFPLRPVPESSE